MTKSRIFLFLLLSFVLGIGVRSLFFVSYFVLFLFVCFAAALTAAGILRKNKNYIACGFFAVFFVAGVLRFDAMHRGTLDPRVLGEHNFRGVIAEEPEYRAASQQLAITADSIDGSPISKKFALLAVIRRYPEYHMGDEVAVTGILKKPDNINEFDYASYLASKGISAVMQFPKIEKIGEVSVGLRLFLSQVKRRFDEKIDELFHEPYGAFLKGLLLGERTELPESFNNALKQTGTTHVIALSGYNITIVGKFFLAILLVFTIPFQIAFWIASGFIVLFIMLTGLQASAVRAGIMGILALVAQNEGRAYRMTNALAFAAFLMILQNPFILRFDTGFQLSFLATCGILYLPQRMEQIIDAVKRRLGVLKNLFSKNEDRESFNAHMYRTFIETISAQAFVLPYLLFAFGSVSFISPLTNIMILPAIPYAMGAGFIAAVSAFFFLPIAKAASWCATFLLSYIITLIEWCAKIPTASFSLSFFPWYFLVLGYVLIAFWLFKTRTVNQGLKK